MTSPHSKSPPPKFVQGSLLRHILVMTSTSTVGLMAIFMVDLANLFYISLLGKQELAAAVGYAGTIIFFSISISIGIMIAAIALISRALGARDRERARKLSGSSLLFVAFVLTAITALYFPFIDQTVGLLGAEGKTRAVATDFLQVVIPSMPLMGLGMGASGLLRSVGDAKRAMYVTLGGGICAAVLDPIFIFTFDLGIQGAAYVTVIARFVTVLIGLYGIIKVHDMLAMPSFSEFTNDVRELMNIAMPAVLTNIATPVGNAYVTISIAPYGDEAVAGWAIIGRLIPVAFGFIYALSGAIGPIIGQNYGATEYDRVRRTITDSLVVTLVYTCAIWLIMYLLRDMLIDSFKATGETAILMAFFINIVIVSFLFNGAMFVANAAFNNLGFAVYSTALNWGKATIGTIPFVWAGSVLAQSKGVIAGQGVGAVVFGIISIIVCLHVIKKIGKTPPDKTLRPPLWRSALPAFSSAKSANLP
ncbi:MAG: MATE family efflux transporter [Hyphomicrobiales bacterium]